ncbi:flagellar type III secretion system protein FlhB [Roseomonas sp. SSH11]|uniref:Flagellar type III secretion system protein FlhB n=1 Tax=Pararoseomonas baculiformis TaxID=2820812 RepID=A0ABS4AKR1_9PROT|nr:flagellar type III secretion system protein FlhB [Pararoseomonas baculiformis]
MSEEQGDVEDRQHEASQRRLDQARERGDVPLGREVVQLASFASAAVALGVLGPQLGRDLLHETRALFSQSHSTNAEAAFSALLMTALPVTLGVAGAAALGGAAATLFQTRLLVSSKALAPKPSKLSPFSGVKRMFGPHGLQEFARALLKLGAIGVALWWATYDLVPVLGNVLAEPPDIAVGVLADLLGRLVIAALSALAVLAAADFLWVRLRFARRLRMSLKEVKDESKESEGDPHLRAVRRAKMRSRSRRRMLDAVSKATVIVTNPTHYAVALAYERGVDAAPRVVARGVDEMAARIRRAADKHGVPLISNPPLARALYKLDDDAQIPSEHFQAAAELIALVWRMHARRNAHV